MGSLKGDVADEDDGEDQADGDAEMVDAEHAVEPDTVDADEAGASEADGGRTDDEEDCVDPNSAGERPCGGGEWGAVLCVGSLVVASLTRGRAVYDHRVITCVAALLPRTPVP